MELDDGGAESKAGPGLLTSCLLGLWSGQSALDSAAVKSKFVTPF